MSIFLKSLLGGAKGVGKLTLGGGGRRMFTGMAAGGIYGGATSEANTPTGMFRDVVGGAAIGAGIGGLTTKTAIGAARTIGRGALRVPQTLRAASAARKMGAGRLEALSFGRHAARRSSIGKNAIETGAGLVDVGKYGARKAFGLGRFAYRNPKTTALLGAGGVGMYALATSGAGESGMGEAEMSAITTMHGGSSAGFGIGMGASHRQGSRQMFMDSTFGLVQGMHAGRHK